MAAAGLKRLGITHFPGLIFRPLTVTECVPAAGQGAIAVQARKGDGIVWDGILCTQTAQAVSIERAALSALGGGCHNSAAAHWTDGRLYLFDESFGRREVPFDASEPAGIRAAVESLLKSF